jgi:uncharacterized repeat protein (TIGR03803 family)
MQNCSSIRTSSRLAMLLLLGLGWFGSVWQAPGATLGTNETFAYILAVTPDSDSKKVDSATNLTSALITSFSNRVAVADAFGSAEGYLAFASTTTLENGELRSVKLVAAGGGTAQGSSPMPNGGHGAFASVGIYHGLTFYSSNETIVEIKSSGQVRLYGAITNSLIAFTNLYTGYVGVDVAPINPFTTFNFNRTIHITNQVRTERLSFPGGQYHRIEINFFEGAQTDDFPGIPANPSGNSTIDVEITFAASTNEVRWVNLAGGSYFRTNNWNPPRVPEKSDRRADVALFELPVQYEVDSSELAPQGVAAFSAPRATAERWVLQGGEVRNVGGAKLFGGDPSLPSLSLGKGSRLNLQSGTLSTVNTRIGDGGAAMSEVWIMGDRSKWTNSGSIFVGEYAPGQILGFDSELKTEEVRLGMGQKGEAYLRGRQAKWEAGNVAVGYSSSTGKLSIESGAYMETRGLYLGFEEGSRGELVISGKSSERASTLWSLGTNVIGRLGPAEMRVLDGATFLHTEAVNLSTFQASVTRSRPARLIAQGVNVSGDPSYIFGGGEIFIGGGGSLEARDGGLIEFASGWIGLPGGGEINASGVHTPTRKRSLIHFRDGLVLGWANDASSTIVVTNGAKVLIEGECGFGGLSEYFVAIHTEKDGYSAELEITDPFMEFNAGQTLVFSGGLLRTKSAILSGMDGTDAAMVISSDPIFPGWIAVGDIRIGSSAGPAELVLIDGGVVSCTGTVTTYPGRGRISGVGTIRTLVLTNSGNFSGGNSPGTITIEGDFVQTDTGKLEIEINGTEPGRFDLLKVTGRAEIGGTIEYVFNNYFIPRTGDKFAALQVTGASSKTAQEVFAGTPLGVGSMETRVTNGVVEVASVTATNYNVFRQFGTASEGSTNGWGPMALATDGLIYGCLRNGGTFGGGAIYSVQPEGHEFRILHHFNPTNQGAQPLGGIFQASNGSLFGTCSVGGTNNGGTIWRIEPAGENFRVLRHFGIAEDLTNPSAELMERSDGFLIGTAQSGGFENRGGVFLLNKDSGGYRVMNDFSGGLVAAPRGPLGGLVEGANRTLYGTTERGGSANNGTVFMMTPNDQVTTIASLGVVPAGAHFPQCTLLLDNDGMMYGTTYSGGRSNFGTVFAVRTNGTGFTLLRAMGVATGEGREPRTGLVEAPDGTLLGTTRIGGGANQGTVFRVRKDGTQYATVRSFNGMGGEGARLRAPLLQTVGGVFYGTTFGGGAGDKGVLFRLFAPNLIPVPTLANQPHSVLGAPGSTLTFAAAVNGAQHLRYQWLHQGTNIPGAFSSTLTLPGADAGKVGEYKVLVTGLTGEVTSQSVQASLFSITTNRGLVIQGTPGSSYRIESAERLGSPTVWMEMTNVVLSGNPAIIPTGNGGARFFRTALASP